MEDFHRENGPEIFVMKGKPVKTKMFSNGVHEKSVSDVTNSRKSLVCKVPRGSGKLNINFIKCYQSRSFSFKNFESNS